MWSAVRRLGFDSVTDLIAERPRATYQDLARELSASCDPGVRVAPVALRILQVNDAHQRGRLREAAADALVRCLREVVRGGWAVSKRAEVDALSAFSAWSSTFAAPAVAMPAAHKFSQAVWEALRALPPEQGWLPADGADPLVEEAFRVGWPAEQP